LILFDHEESCMRSVRRLIFGWPTAPLLALVVTCTAAAVLSSVQAGAAPRADGPTDDAAVHSYLEDPGRVAEGQVAPHARLWPYADDGSAVRAADSPYVRSLDGAWKFTLADKPADVPGGCQKPGYDSSGWSTVQVPHTWQSDFIDHPMFRNIPEEVWPDAPPKVPRDVNPTGAYLKTFDVPRAEGGRRQLLRFEGVTSGYFVWVNGKYAGYDQGGYSPAEFDITDLANSGPNTLAVQVHRWGSGSYLEDYDQWRYAGIFRDVYSYSVPEARIQDAYVTTDLDATYTDATLAVDTKLARDGDAPAGAYQVAATYSRPQAYGNHTDTRWASLADTRNGLLVAASKADTVDVSATPYDRLDLAEYDFQRPLVRNKGWVTLHVEDVETGMGRPRTASRRRTGSIPPSHGRTP
jgi:beta-galactosidase